LASWQSWYARYTSKTIFGGGDSWPSSLAEKQPKAEYLQWITHVTRGVFSKDRLIFNDALIDCFTREGWPLPRRYLPSVVNTEACYSSFWKYNKPQPSPQRYAWKLSYDWMERHFRPHMGGSQEFPRDFVLREMNMDSSPGYPWSLTYHTKKLMLEDERMMKVLPDYFEACALTYPCDIVPIWTCSVKGDELRPVEKIMANKLRTFTASPFEHSTALNMLCLDMNNRFYRSAGKTWSFVGRSLFRGEWNLLGQQLETHPNKNEVDGKEYDSSLFAEMLWDLCFFRFCCLAPEYRTERNWNVLRNLYDSIINSVCVLDLGDLIRKFTGNPSGSSNTIVDNTLALARLFFYAWIVIAFKRMCEVGDTISRSDDPLDPSQPRPTVMPEESYDYTFMMRHVAAAMNGDDLDYSVSDFVNDWFTPQAIAEVWTDIGVVTVAGRTVHDLTQLSFLSHTFVMKAGLWLPSPETDKVLGSLYVGSKHDDVRWHLMRAYALRTQSFMNDECRYKIEKLIDYMHANYQDMLVGFVNGIPMDSIRAMWHSDTVLWRLYTGQEYVPSVDQEFRLKKLALLDFSHNDYIKQQSRQSSGLIVIQQMSSDLKKAIEAIKKVDGKARHAWPAKPEVFKKKQGKRKKKGGKKHAQQPAPTKQFSNQEVAVVKKMAYKALSVADGQKLYARAARNAFKVRMPPLEHTRVPMEKVTGRFDTSTGPNGSASYFLFIPNLSMKGGFESYYQLNSASNWVADAATDVWNIGSYQKLYSEMRFGLSAMEVYVETTSDVLAPQLYVGQMPSNLQDPTAYYPGHMRSIFGATKVPKNYAYIANVPRTSASDALLLSSYGLNAGRTNAGKPFIYVSNCGTDATKVRIDVRFVVQAEATKKDDASQTLLPADPETVVDNTNANWSLGETMDTVSNFVWRASSAFEAVPSDWKASALGLAADLLSSKVNHVKAAMDVKDEDTVSVTVYHARMTYTHDEVANIIADPPTWRKMQDGMSEADIAKFIAFSHEVVHNIECVGCHTLIAEGSLCSVCEVTLRQFRDTQANNGVTSVDSTPEPVTRQLDALRMQLTGKVPPVKDLNRFGINPTPKAVSSIIQQ